MRDPSEIVIIGAGGHAKVVISAACAMGLKVVGAYDDDSAKWGQAVLGVPILGPVEKLDDRDGPPLVLAIGDSTIRRRITERYGNRGWATIIHPSAWIDPSVKIGPGTVVFAGSVIQPDVTIGSHAIINTAASADHDCVLDDFVHLGPGCHLAANVRVGLGAFLGTGVSVIPGIVIGEHSIIGAGATVIRDICPSVTAVGCPARVINHPRQV